MSDVSQPISPHISPYLPISPHISLGPKVSDVSQPIRVYLVAALSVFAAVSPGGEVVHTLDGRPIAFGTAAGTFLQRSWGYVASWYLPSRDANASGPRVLLLAAGVQCLPVLVFAVAAALCGRHCACKASREAKAKAS